MEHLANEAIGFISVNRAWAVPVVALLCFGESLALVGLAIPATSLMIATGSLLATGRLDPVTVTPAAVVGAALGDWVSYILGRRLGPSAYRRWPLCQHRTAVAQARLFFRRYGFLAIFAGRFLGPLRAIAPLIAGVTRMPGRDFQVANVVSAVVWVPLLFAPGYLAARHLARRGEVGEGTLVLVGLAVGLACVLLGWFASKATAARRRAKRARS